jgi:hypothetical protein
MALAMILLENRVLYARGKNLFWQAREIPGKDRASICSFLILMSSSLIPDAV